MNHRGQALVEFVIILPIFIFMLLGIIDIGKVVYTRVEMESELSDVVDLYRKERTYEEIKEVLAKEDENIKLEITNQNNESLTFTLKKDIEIITPGLGLIIGNPCSIDVKRVISYE